MRGTRLGHRSLKLCGLLVLNLCLAFPGLLLADPTEPQAHGYPLSYWLEHYMTRATDSQRKEASEAEAVIREIGTNALPALIAWLRYEPSQTKTDIQAFLARLRLKSYGRWVPSSLTYDKRVPPAN